MRHVVCTACGCTCDDVELQVEAGRIAEVRGACALGEAYFAAQTAEASRPAAVIAGREAPVAEALAEAARLLAAARYPLVYGFTQTTAEAQRVAVRLADLIGANVDPAVAGAEAVALQAVGRVSCSLGEVKNRADLVIYWGCNPAVEYPHHFRRYGPDAPGRWVPNGRRDRTVVLVDSHGDEGDLGDREDQGDMGEQEDRGKQGDLGDAGGAAWADLVLSVPPGAQFDLLQVLRALVNGRRVNQAAAGGIGLEQAQALVERMKQARFGVVFFGPRLSAGPGGWAHVAALTALAADLNQFTRFYAMGMGATGNAAGAEGVLSSETGYPFAVNLSRGYPRYSPGEFTAVDLLARGEADAVLAVTSDLAAGGLPERARAHLARIPVVSVGPEVSPQASVHLTTAPYGVSAEGTVYRTDEIPLPLRPSLPSAYPTDEEMLTRLFEELNHA